MDTQPLDPSIVRLAQAISKTETGGSKNAYTATGKSGEYGAYQYTPETWAGDSQKYLGKAVPLNEATPAQQDEVAYNKIKELGTQGYKPAQIASIWNSGEPDPNTIGTGVNKKYGVAYDVPGYVKKVEANYNDLQQKTAAYNPDPYSQGQSSLGGIPGAGDGTGTPPSDPNSLGGQIQQRGQDASAALNQASTGLGELSQGKLGAGLGDVASGALQTAGAVAGGAGDVIQKGIEQIPGVKSLESGLANVLGGIADTSLGKSVIGSVTKLAQAHPEIAKDLGAAANIASVIPMFKAIGAIPGIAKDAIGMAAKKSLLNAAGEEMTGVAEKTIGGRQLLSTSEKRGLNPVRTILDSGALPEVIAGADGVPRYSTASAYEAMSTQKEEDALQYALKSAPMTEGGQASLEVSRKNALKQVAKQFEDRTDYDAAIKEVNQIFDSYESRFGKNVFLDKINQLKRGVRDSVNFNSPKLQSDIHYLIGQSLMDDVEAGAKRLGVKGVSELNKAMQEKINARRLLKAMDGKQPRLTQTGKFSRAVKKGLAGAAGELVGSSVGVPFAGTLAGMGAESALIKNAPDSALFKLGQLGTRTDIRSTTKKGLIGASLLGAQRAKPQ